MKKYEVEGHVPSFLPDGHEWKLVWNDEFDGTELDESKWGFRLNFWGKRFALAPVSFSVIQNTSIRSVPHNALQCRCGHRNRSLLQTISS